MGVLRPVLAPPVDLHIRGIPINRGDLQQGRPAHRPHQAQHPGVDLPDRGLNTPQVRGGETARDPGRSRRRRGRHRFQQLSGHIRTPPVQTDQEITTGQLARGHRHHQATPANAAATFLDRPHARVQRGRDPQNPIQLPDRLDPRAPRQPGIRRTDPHPPRPNTTLPSPLTLA